MPNWCFTTTAIIADVSNELAISQLNKLYSVFTKKVETQEGADSTWIGNYLHALGIIPNTNEKGFRSFVECVDDKINIRDGIMYFTIDTDDAWVPQTLAFDKIISDQRFCNLRYEYVSEEPGCGVYVNTDEDGIIFTDHYKIEYEAVTKGEKSPNYDSLYLETEADYLSTLEELFGIHAESYEDSEKAVMEYCEENLDDDSYITVAKYYDRNGGW